ncbi:TRZ/ATZ family protein [Petralouisia muris]|uniref:TRZ/ATZ family protein n=1 Tax=Petralouisia muris TaxID=3032872 RepID=A0AC61RWA3_9FIRM|nr:fumarate hydratase C-terminal domain-containing protein [Petralouisia muris]TGY95901.1 TRZ/ATZ family protein [Petralouisia muris]
MDKYIKTPITAEVTEDLRAGDYVYITGTVYVARDAAHKRLVEALEKTEREFYAERFLSKTDGLQQSEQEKLQQRLRETLPFPIVDSVLYYMGPSPAREGRPIGSAGPTTASRMDRYAPRLLDLGQKAMIGKGKRTKEVIDGIIRNQAVYFAAVGGAGALLSKCIKKSETICYEDLGAEAVLKLEVDHFPVIVVIDREGNNLYETAAKEYEKGK